MSESVFYREDSIERFYPMWKVEFKEYLYRSDCDLGDDICKRGKIKYYKKNSSDTGWTVEYEEFFTDYLYAMHKAAITLMELNGVVEPDDDVVMFRYGDTMFKFDLYIKSQKAVCGEAIDSWYYNDYEDDRNIKIALLGNNVFFYNKDELVVECRRIYLNGKMVMTAEQAFDELGLLYYQIENMYPMHVIRKLKERFPEAKAYVTLQGRGSMEIPVGGEECLSNAPE